MTENLLEIIVGIGFNHKEAGVYLACLELAGAPNAQIAKKTKLNRITNYEILKRLEKRGAVVGFTKRRVRHFVGTDPRLLIKGVREHVAVAEQSIPELLAITNRLVRKPKVSFLEDISGIKAIYDDSLNATTEIITFTNPADVRKLLGNKYVDSYVENRVKKKISVRGIAPDDPMGRKEKDVGTKALRDVRLFSTEKYKISNEIMIYDEKVAVFSESGEVGLIIEDKKITDSLRNVWQMVWDSSGEPKR